MSVFALPLGNDKPETQSVRIHSHVCLSIARAVLPLS